MNLGEILTSQNSSESDTNHVGDLGLEWDEWYRTGYNLD